MPFTIATIIFTILAVIAGSRLANLYSVYALVPVTFFTLALAVAGSMVYGANLFGSVLATLSGVTGLQFGYLLRLFVHHDRPLQRRLGGPGPDARRFVPQSGNS